MEHVSVLRDEVKRYLDLKDGEVAVDGTLGLGGHAMDILKSLGKAGKLIAFDQDERNLVEAKKRLADFDSNIVYFQDNFRHLKTRVTGIGISQVDAILLDLGLSSPHVDDPDRGFAFRKEGPLDMRFDLNQKLTAADILNTYEEADLADIFWRYGEERLSKKIARMICNRRKEQLFGSTTDLAALIERAYPPRFTKMDRGHPAAKIFQALRIAVNDELAALEEVLDQSFELLGKGGRLVVISYHSLEDRIVKLNFKALAQPKASAEESIYSNYGAPLVNILTHKPVTPTEKELELNPRSRSGKLRAYEKI
jgi:16S rRNA (cytosine1402-N4)-methyltransferase